MRINHFPFYSQPWRAVIISVATTLLVLSITSFLPANTGICGEKKKEITSIEIEDRDVIRRMYEDNFIDYAEEESASYLEKYPRGIFRDEVTYIRAQIAVKNKQYSQAISYLEEIIREYPGSAYVEDALYYSGILYIQTERFVPGEKNLKRLLESYPQSQFTNKANYQLGQLAFSKKDWSAAEESLTTTHTVEDLTVDQSLEAKRLLAWSQYFQGNVEQAESAFENLLETELDSAEKAKIAYQLGIDTYQNKSYPRAVKWFDKILQNWPDSEYYQRSVFWKAESMFMRFQGAPDQYDEPYKQEVISLYTKNLDSPKPIELENSHYHRGWLLLDLGKTAVAEEDFEWLQVNRATYAKDLDLTLIRAQHFESTKNWADANQIYLNSIKTQTDPSAQRQLLIRVSRNDYRQNDCDALLSHANQIELEKLTTARHEIMFYLGKCHFRKAEWTKALRYFEEIPPTSDYAPAIFEDSLSIFRKTNQLERGITYLNSVEFQPAIAPHERLLLYKTDFQLKLKQWLPAIRTINQILAINPKKSKEPLFILNLAKIYDQILNSYDDQDWLKANPKRDSAEYYNQQALENYELAYKLLEQDELATKRAILDLLINRYQRGGQRKPLVHTYERAIELAETKEEKDTLIYNLANLLIKTPSTRKSAVVWLQRLHLAGIGEKYFHASSLLSELYISEENIPEAIKILSEVSAQIRPDSKWYTSLNFRLGELYQFTENWEASLTQYRLVEKAEINSPKMEEARLRADKIDTFLKGSAGN